MRAHLDHTLRIAPATATNAPAATVSAAPARILSRRFLRGYVVTMRPYLLFVSGITGIVGLALAPRAPIAGTALLATAFFLSYGFGQALTDCFQTDTDALSAPYRPLVRGEIRRKDVMAVSLIGLLAIGIILAAYNHVTIPLAAGAVLGLATYTYFKRRWWAGPFYNAWIVAVLALIGYVGGVGAAHGQLNGSLVLAGMLIAVFFGYSNFVLTGYYKDVSADRATGYNTLPVVFGLRISTRVSHIFAGLTLVGCGIAIWDTLTTTQLGLGHGVALVLLAAGSAVAIAAQVRLRSVDESTAHRAIAPVVHAYILLLAGVAVWHKPDWAWALALFYTAFVVTMTRRPMRGQI